MSKFERRCPPYEGGDPYLYLCFDERDSEAVFPLLEHLYRRGIRIWYNIESTADMKELDRQQKRMNGASLVVLYLTDNVREAGNKKNTLLYYQQQGKPVISIDTDSGDNELSVGLTEAAKHIDAQAIRSAEEMEATLIRTEGFSQELIGDPPAVKNNIGRAAAIILAIALLVAGVSFYGYKQHGWFVTWLPTPTPMPTPVVTPTPEPVLVGDVRESMKSDLEAGFSNGLMIYVTTERKSTHKSRLKEGLAGGLAGQRAVFRELEAKKVLRDSIRGNLAAGLKGSATPMIIDTVTFSDAKLTDALRTAVGGGMITTKSLEQVTRLRLEEVPGDLSELKEKVPNLTMLILPQEAAKKAGIKGELPDLNTLILKELPEDFSELKEKMPNLNTLILEELPENISGIKGELPNLNTLILKKLPGDFSELKEKMPNLTTLILPHEEAKKALDKVDGKTTIVLAPEGEAAQ